MCNVAGTDNAIARMILADIEAILKRYERIEIDDHALRSMMADVECVIIRAKDHRDGQRTIYLIQYRSAGSWYDYFTYHSEKDALEAIRLCNKEKWPIAPKPKRIIIRTITDRVIFSEG